MLINGLLNNRLLVLIGLLLPTAVRAQAPESWNQRTPLGADLPEGASWLGAGLWAGDQHGGPAPLVDALGLGNALTGGGPSVEGGVNLDRLSFAAQVLGNADPGAGPKALLYRWHLTWASPGGWKASLEAEPLVWGYGNLGGYLLGESARPFPRFRVASPYRHLSLGGWSLGEWGFQWFTGRLEAGRGISPLSQMPLTLASVQAEDGEPQHPFLSGYRFQSRSRDGKVEFYLNWTVLWGGDRNGVSMTSGYNLADYLVAITGTKDPTTESNVDFSDPNHPAGVAPTRAQSATNFDVGWRWQPAFLARAFGSDKAWFYVSRGTKGMLFQWGVAAHRPLFALQQDVRSVTKDALQGNFSALWNKKDSYYLPNLIVPNDTVGIALQWPGARLALEHHDTSNPAGVSYRSFVNGVYTSGFYTYGDALGEALGGEANTTDARLELDLGPRLTTTTWVLGGLRYFRDDPALWAAAHPGLEPTKDPFLGAQESLAWKVGPHATLDLGASWQRHAALQNVPGAVSNGFRWFSTLAYRWSKGH